MAAPGRIRALRAYRDLLRTCHTVFRGDTEALQIATNNVRVEFEKNRNLGQEEAEKAIADVAEAKDFLLHNIVQARLNDRGNYSMSLEERHTSEEMRVESAADRADGVHNADELIRKESGCRDH